MQKDSKRNDRTCVSNSNNNRGRFPSDQTRRKSECRPPKLTTANDAEANAGPRRYRYSLSGLSRKENRVQSKTQQRPLWMHAHSSVSTAAVDVRCFLSHYRCTQSSQPLWMYTVFYSNSHYGCTQFSQPLRMYTVFSATVDVHSLPSHYGCTQSSQPLWVYTVFPATVGVHSLLSHCECTQSSQPLWVYTVFPATMGVHSLPSHYGCTQSSQPLWVYTVFPATMGVHSLLQQ